MTAKQKKLFLLTSMMSVFVMAVTVLFTGEKLSSFKTPFARATNSGNYSVSFNRTICGNTGYSSDDFTKESQLSVSKSTVYAHAVKAMVTNGSDFARFKAEEGAYIEFYIDSNVSFQEITGFSFTYNSMYPNGDFDIYLSTDGSTYPASPNAEVRNAPETVNLSGYNVKKIKFAGLSNKYAYFNTITINYACGEAAPVTLSSISLSGQTTEFSVGGTFTFGGTVTAHYSDSTTSDVTSNATFSGYDLSTAGEQTVTVSYTESGVTKETSYLISVNDSESSTVDLEGKSYTFTSRTLPYNTTTSKDWTGRMTITFESDGRCTWNSQKPSNQNYNCDVFFTYVATNNGSAITLEMVVDTTRKGQGTHSGYYFRHMYGETNSSSDWSGGTYDRPHVGNFGTAAHNDSGSILLDFTTLTIKVYDQSASYAEYDTFTFSLVS